MEGLRIDEMIKKDDKGKRGYGEAYPERAEDRAWGTDTEGHGAEDKKEDRGRWQWSSERSEKESESDKRTYEERR